MVWLLATGHDVAPPRATEDVDVVVDVRADPAGIQKLCRWLEGCGFKLDGISAEGIGHRYIRAADPGPAAITMKAAATHIPSRSNPDRDWHDAAFLLSLVSDPIAAAQSMSRAERGRLRPLAALSDTQHPAWRALGSERARLGQATLDFLLA
jgi:hypothetical protein